MTLDEATTAHGESAARGAAMYETDGRREYIGSHAMHAYQFAPDRFREWAGRVYEILAMRVALEQRLCAALESR